MPKVSRIKYCEVCSVKLEDPHSTTKYCGDACRKEAERARKRGEAQLAEVGMTPEQVSEAARKLATSPAFEDEVREVMREEIRHSMQQYVRDRVLGFVDGMVGMLPTVLVQLNRDLNSESWPERKTAYAIVTKYVMPMMGDPNDTSNAQNNLVIQIGEGAREAFAEEIVDAEYVTNGPEEFEADWPECVSCSRRMHPDNVVDQQYNGLPAKWCRACLAKHEYSGDKMPVEGGLSGRGRHADLLG